MKLLLDTHLILWLFGAPELVAPRVMRELQDTRNEVLFSPVNLFEIAVKSSKGRNNFVADAVVLRNLLLERGVVEACLTSEQALVVLKLPQIHKDPFDRLLLAQAIAMDAQLVTVDAALLRYPSHVFDAR